jgi:hypothetical protein
MCLADETQILAVRLAVALEQLAEQVSLEECPSLTERTLTTARFSDKYKGKCAALIVMTPKVLGCDPHPADSIFPLVRR